jgi:hypothetical protein
MGRGSGRAARRQAARHATPRRGEVDDALRTVLVPQRDRDRLGRRRDDDAADRIGRVALRADADTFPERRRCGGLAIAA